MLAAVQKCRNLLFRATFIVVNGTLLFRFVSQATLCVALLQYHWGCSFEIAGSLIQFSASKYFFMAGTLAHDKYCSDITRENEIHSVCCCFEKVLCLNM